ncbi:TPA_asm: P3 [Pogostemom alphacytorhabdovirus 2]|nr:TPA_asm: P3 [Pogostemom alphacytorhabdovirus 2]
MTTSFSFSIKEELVMSEESGIVALTKKLNVWQAISAKWSENVQISRILFNYESRAGPIAEGIVTASIIDNRAIADLTDNVLKSVSFRVTQDVSLSWDHNVNFHRNDLRSGEESPLVLITDISECNMKPGYSLGQMRIKIEFQTSNKMIRRITHSPIIKLFRDHRMTSKEQSNRRVSLESLEASSGRPVVIKPQEISTAPSLSRSVSALQVPRKKYYVSKPVIDC